MGGRVTRASPGPTQEHLGASDKAIAAYRRILIDAIEQAAKGKRPLMVLDEAAAERIRGPVTLDGITESRALKRIGGNSTRGAERARRGRRYTLSNDAPGLAIR